VKLGAPVLTALMSVILITVVQTIVVSITDVDPGYAVAIVAGEEIPEAGSSLGFAVIWGLISTITTVIIPVAVPGGRNASVLRPEDRLGRHVAEVHVLFANIKVQGHHIHQVLVHQVVLMSIDRHVAHIVLVGEDQPGRDFVFSLAGVFVVLPLVVGLITLAVESTRGVGTVLRAGSWLLQALVHIRTRFAIGQKSVKWKELIKSNIL